jgi:acyl carrier protein
MYPQFCPAIINKGEKFVMANVKLDDVKKLIANQLGLSSVNESDRIVEDLGAESADIANIVAAVEDKYQITVSEDQIKALSTVRDVFISVQKA